jgi:hypothetical protein
VIPYFDVIAMWTNVIDPRTRAELESHCGHLHVKRGPSPWWSHRNRLEFKQPDESALRWIATHADAPLNRAQITLDLIFDTRAERDATRGYFDAHLIRRWHRRSQKIQYYDDDKSLTRYDAPRTAANRIIRYAEEYSRWTGELYCLHVEWEARGRRAVAAAGIVTPRDLLSFDHRVFWARRLRLVTIDPGRLGRLFGNRAGPRHRAITDRDRWFESRVLHCVDDMQGLLDIFGVARIARVLTPLPVEPYLPAPAPAQLSTQAPADDRATKYEPIVREES